MRSAPSKRFLLSHAGPDCYLPLVRLQLARLGALILLPEEYRQVQRTHSEPPELLLLTPDQLEAVGDFVESRVIVLGALDEATRDPRVDAAVEAPASLRSLYRPIQQLTEHTPRSTPRVATELAARCGAGGARSATILSLSERGCLLRSQSGPPLGKSWWPLEFDLGKDEWISVEARVAYTAGPDAGAVFRKVSPRQQEVLASFIDLHLLGS